MPLATPRAEFTARYFVESSVPSEKAAEVIAGEQSSETFMALPGETEQLKVRSRARVVDTPMTRLLHTDWFREEYAKAIPMNRYGTTVEIAAAVMYLVSDAASYTSGVLLLVDGGFVASGARGR